ncbi:DMT family transporter [Streptomyces aidingensis]|uniref:Permease of the drug/metabolite transporter (DMT) superfamily n=1 Tax=Streptomyces aidingensis TaxID=910347 RepID=A0A1I1V7C9_9ACTN|nr:DMT family transporter [Streptomyces aidingensis]SFD76290.1 Permease of the drug/metabolite transporter (DMT) superfamily [Streptomyces aidingensis]
MSPRGWALFSLMGVVWGIPYLMIKVAVAEVSVPMVVFSRCALGLLLLLPFALRAGGFGPLRGHWVPVLLFAGVEIVGPWALLSHAERELSSSMTGLLIAAVPILTALLTRLTRLTGGGSGDGGERLGPRRWTGLLLGLGGVALLAAPHLSGGSALSVGEVLLTAFGYTIAPLIAARRLREVPTLQLTTACLAVATAVYAVPAWLTRPSAVPSGEALASLAGLGAVCTALGFLLFFELLREVGTGRAVVFTYVNPAVAVAAGVLLLSEPLTAVILVSFAAILTGSFLATAPAAPAPRPPRRRRPAAARAQGEENAARGTADR